jgi:hypothetical protein
MLALSLLGAAGLFVAVREGLGLLGQIAAGADRLIVAVGAGPSLAAVFFPWLYAVYLLRRARPANVGPVAGARLLLGGAVAALALGVLATLFLLDYPEYAGYRDCGQVPGMYTRLALHHGFALPEAACPRG